LEALMERDPEPTDPIVSSGKECTVQACPCKALYWAADQSGRSSEAWAAAARVVEKIDEGRVIDFVPTPKLRLRP
jgi:hypothetical protein